MSELIETRIGPLPNDWEIEPLDEVTTKIQDGTHFSPQSIDGPCRYITSKNIRFGRMAVEDCGWISQKEHDAIYARCDVRYGDVLLTKDGANTGNAALNRLNEPFSLLSSVALIRVDERTTDNGFLLQYLLSPRGQQRLKDLMAGNAITRLTLEKIKRFEVPQPVKPEQAKIARILTTLDNLIENTEALIAKYQSIKQGMMHDLFTRGVDSHGHLRPTPDQAPDLYDSVDGRFFPKTWRRCPLREYADVAGGITLGRKLDDKLVIDLPYLRVANVQDGYLDLTEMKTVSVLKSEVERYLLQPGDVVMTEGGDFDKLGRGTVWEGQVTPCLHQNHVFRVRPHSEELNSAFLSHLTGSAYGRHYFLMCAKQTTNLASINATQVKAFPLILPSPEEQEMIVERTAAIDGKIISEQRQVEKLRLIKSGLMQDLLTGKVRVTINPSEEACQK